jgi:hypothetical protein
MAFKKDTKTPFGFDAPYAYHRIENLHFQPKIVDQDGKVTYMIGFNLRVYKDNSGVPFFAETPMFCILEIDEPNPIKQAYEYIKKLTEYADVVDC